MDWVALTIRCLAQGLNNLNPHTHTMHALLSSTCIAGETVLASTLSVFFQGLFLLYTGTGKQLVFRHANTPLNSVILSKSDMTNRHSYKNLNPRHDGRSRATAPKYRCGQANQTLSCSLQRLCRAVFTPATRTITSQGGIALYVPLVTISSNMTAHLGAGKSTPQIGQTSTKQCLHSHLRASSSQVRQRPIHYAPCARSRANTVVSSC